MTHGRSSSAGFGGRRWSVLWPAMFFLYFFAVTIPSAHAYIDPGTGSYVFQVVIGVLLGAAVAVKMFWRRIWRFVTRKPGTHSAERLDPGPADRIRDEAGEG